MYQFPGHQRRAGAVAEADLDLPDHDLDADVGPAVHAQLATPPGHALEPPHGFGADLPDAPVPGNAQGLAGGGEGDINGSGHAPILGPAPDD